jgi:hypothetical protein
MAIALRNSETMDEMDVRNQVLEVFDKSSENQNCRRAEPGEEAVLRA